MRNVSQGGVKERASGRWQSLIRLPPWLRRLGDYGLALVFVAAAATLRWALPEVLGPTPFLAFYLAWVGAAVFGGLGPGLLATVASWACISILFDPAGGLTDFGDPRTIGRLVVLLAGGLTVSVVAEAMRRGRIRERRQARDLAHAKQEWERTFDAVPDLIAIIDPQHRILRTNRAMAERLGTTPEGCLGLTCYRCVHDLDAPPLFCPHAATLADGREHAAEVYEERLGGHFFVTCTPLFDQDGRMIGSVHVARDITERKRAEEALRQSDLFYRQTLESIPGMVFTTRPDGYCDYQSQQWVDYTGVPMSEHLGDGWNKLLHPEDRPRAFAAWRAAVEGRAPYDLEYRVRRRDGQYEWFRVIGRPIRDATGQIVRWFGVVTNVETLKRAEEALRQANERLRKQTEELAATNKDLEQFAYIASHDLQEPLRAVAGFATLLQQRYGGKLDEKADSYINAAVEGAARMQALINGLLEYSRVGTRGNVPAPANADEVVQEALEDLQTLIQESGALITSDPLPTVQADASQLTHVFQNLIANAIKFRSEQTPEIHIGARRQDSSWLFWVRDNGIGIDPQYNERIFMIFQRLHTRRKYPGTGIGLAICKRIVERHGGSIWVESQPGQGATFYFTLPDKGETHESSSERETDRDFVGGR